MLIKRLALTPPRPHDYVIKAYSRFGSFPGTRTSKKDWKASAVCSGSGCKSGEVSHILQCLGVATILTMALQCSGGFATPAGSGQLLVLAANEGQMKFDVKTSTSARLEPP